MLIESTIKVSAPQVRQGRVGLSELAEVAVAALAAIQPPQEQADATSKADGRDQATGHSCVPQALSSQVVIITSSRGKEGSGVKRPQAGPLQNPKKKLPRLATESNRETLPQHQRVTPPPADTLKVPMHSPLLPRPASLSTGSNLEAEYPIVAVISSSDVESLALNQRQVVSLDYSREKKEPNLTGVWSTTKSLTLEGRQAAMKQALSSGIPVPPQPTFPQILHDMLSNPMFQHILSWTSHGQAVRFADVLLVDPSATNSETMCSCCSTSPRVFQWRIHSARDLEQTVLPLYFRHAVFSSFRRQVNGWGFRRYVSGSDPLSCVFIC
jgi:HSF-type DNA-binding